MPKTYQCYGSIIGGKYLGTVEAESPQEALEKAQALPSIGVSLCHACADEVEDPEVDTITLVCDGEDVTPAEAPDPDPCRALRGEVTDAQINDACLSFRHDFGLLPPEEQLELRVIAKSWLEAWGKAILEPSYLFRKESK